MSTIADMFGPGPFGDGTDAALRDQADPQTSPQRTYASTQASLQPMDSWRSLIDPKGSAIFWVGIAALIGLVMVTGQFKVQAAFGSRVGKGRG